MKNNGVKFGLIYGGLSILLSLIAYFFDPKNLVSMTSWRGLLGLGLMFATMYLAAKKTRDQKGGFISFGEAFLPPIITYVIGTFIGGFIFMYMLINFIDPSIQEVLKQSTLDMQRGMIEMMGGSEAQVLETLEKIEEEQANQFSIGNGLFGTLSGILMIGLPSSAIIAAIVKKKTPNQV